MKKIRIILAIALAICAAFSVVACRKTDESVPEGYKLAGAQESGTEDRTGDKEYYFYVPSTWAVDINNTATSAFVSPDDRASVSVMTWNAADTTPEKCWDESVKDFERIYADFTVESKENVKLDGIDALSVTYTGSVGDGDGAGSFRFSQVIAVKGTLVCTLTYTNLSERFDDYSEDFSEIVGYFRFK